MAQTGIARPEEFRTVTRAHVIAWRDQLERVKSAPPLPGEHRKAHAAKISVTGPFVGILEGYVISLHNDDCAATPEPLPPRHQRQVSVWQAVIQKYLSDRLQSAVTGRLLDERNRRGRPIA
jgi:hypothetical protein